MSKDEVPRIAKEALSDLLSEPGSILYSSHETLKPGDVCASNQIFLQSRNASGISFSLAEKCWPVQRQ